MKIANIIKSAGMINPVKVGLSKENNSFWPAAAEAARGYAYRSVCGEEA